jgi:predicted porin
MKRLFMTSVVLGACSSAAYGQSSVAIYGIIDIGLNYESNVAGHTAYAESSGMMQGSRFGFLGSEDLGGGLKTVFQLENGFDSTSGKFGQGGLLFGRQAFFGLSNKLGAVTLGRQYDVRVDAIAKFAASNQGDSIAAAHPGDLDDINYTYRSNNSIKFTTAPLFGLVAGAQYSLGGVAGDLTRDQIWALGLSYSAGPFAAGAGYLDVRNPNVGFYGTSSQTPLGSSTANASSPVFSGFTSAHAYKEAVAGASYTVNTVTFGALYSNTRFVGLGDLSSGPDPLRLSGNASFSTYEANVQFQVTPSWLVGAAYLVTNGNTSTGVVGARYQQAAADLHYFLSKRTDVYVDYVCQHASGRDSTGHTAVAAINGLAASGSSNASLVRLGIRHKF